MAVSIGVAGLVIGAAGTVQQMEAQSDARDAANQAAEEQKKIRDEQQAQQRQRAIEERRRQIREKTVRAGQIQSMAAATGGAQGSGELGALGVLATNLNANIGTNLGAISAADRMGTYAQNSSDFMTQAQGSQNKAAMWGQVSSLGNSMFNTAGGFGTLYGAATKPGPDKSNFNPNGADQGKIWIF